MADPESDWLGQNRLVYGIVRKLISLIVALRLLRVVVEGEENVPSHGPVMFMINHQSNLDPLLVGWATRRPINMPGKAELFRVPVLRAIIRGLGSYPVDRDSTDSASLRHSLLVLRQGGILAVFPEGTRSRTGEIGRFGTTLTRLALRECVPVVPVAIDGTRTFLPPGNRLPRFGAKVLLRYGEPLLLHNQYGSRPDTETLEQATTRMRAALVDLLHPPTGDSVRPARDAHETNTLA